jgi:phospholipid/cholesterol/gamma-HCH transport system substrate-binding protein
VFQGQGGTINDILDQTAQLTSQLGERDEAIGQVVKNLNIVLDTTVRHRKEFDQTVNNLEVLITGLKDHKDQLAGGTAHISNAAGTVADLLAEDRTLLHKTINYLDTIQQPLIDQRDQLNDYFRKVPGALNLIGRGIGSYGDFVNFYACDITLKINGLQAGGPVRTVRLLHQPTGRCTPQ